jgi:hypothetical protein
MVLGYAQSQLYLFLYLSDRHSGLKGVTAVMVRKGIPLAHIRIIPVEATGIFLPIGNTEFLFAGLYKSFGRTWSDADVTEFVKFRPKSSLTDNMNGSYLVWNSQVSNPSGAKLLELFEVMISRVSHHNVPSSVLSTELLTFSILCSQKCPTVGCHCLILDSTW